MVWCGIHCAGRSAERLLFCGATKKFSVNRPGKGSGVAVIRRDSRNLTQNEIGFSVNRPGKRGSVAVIKPRKELWLF
eukprot:6079949-Prymnesium_polylepis.1